MTRTSILAALFGMGMVLAPLAASAAGVLTGPNGMTLYTFDKDSKGVSNCYNGCAAHWPPYLVKSGEMMGAPWSKVARKDGTEQWAYNGMPVYYFVGDTAKGDENGNNFKGIWHVIPQ